ncbi:MAG: YraN family protein [Mycobacteriales bacterium]|nr:YraN family protein [Mycobacteriales bacterium]
MDRSELGRYGEDLAAQHLEGSGYTLLDRNWRCARGELDLVALAPDGTVCFVEVKTRTGTGYGVPSEAVTRLKATRIHRLALAWLSDHRPDGHRGALRFDVVSIVRRRGFAPVLTHLEGAF